jgi:hypothetical protein
MVFLIARHREYFMLRNSGSGPDRPSGRTHSSACGHVCPTGSIGPCVCILDSSCAQVRPRALPPEIRVGGRCVLEDPKDDVGNPAGVLVVSPNFERQLGLFTAVGVLVAIEPGPPACLRPSFGRPAFGRPGSPISGLPAGRSTSSQGDLGGS